MKRNMRWTKPSLEWCMMVVLSILAIYLRYTLFAIHTSDYDGYFSAWYDFIQSHGRFTALKYPFSNDHVSYLYFLILATYIPLPKIISIKFIPVVFDAVMALFIYLIVRLKYEKSSLPTMASLITLFTPTVFITSGLWGQFDSIYVSLSIGSLYFLLRKQPWWACVLFGLALSFKLQTLFLFPLLFVLLITGEVPKKYVLVIPIVYGITVLPACLMGRNFIDVLTSSGSWADDPVHHLMSNAPNLFQWLPTGLDDSWKQAGSILALSAVGILSLVVLTSRRRMTNEIILKLALIFVLLMPFFLPGIDERDFYLADIISLIYVFYFPKYFYIAILIELSSLVSYTPYLEGSAVIDLKYITFLVVGVITLMIVDLVHTLPSSTEDAPVEQPIARSLQDVIVLFLLGGLLLYGTFTDHPGDPGIYQCYAMAFWQGGGPCGFIQTNEIVHALQQWGLPSGFVQLVTAQPPHLPYHSLPNEYPLLALLPFSVGLLAPSSQYQMAFGLEMLLFVGGIYFVLRFSRSRRAALAFSLYVLVGGWMTAAGRFDLVPAALTLFAVICAAQKRWNWAFAFLALATLSKEYPAILLIPFFLALQPEIQGKWYAWRRWLPMGVFVGICVLVIGISLLLNEAGTLAPLGYFFVRPVEWESLSGSLFWIANVLWKTPLAYVGGFGSLNVESPLSFSITLLMGILQIVGLLSTWWLQRRGRMDLAMTCLLTLLIVMVTGKVFSIQYLIWVIPLAAYVGQSNRWWLLFWTLMGFLTSWRLTVLLVNLIYPHLTFQSVYGTPLFYTPLYTLRNFLLLGFILSTLISRTLLSHPLSFEPPTSWWWKESLKEISSFLSKNTIARSLQDVIVLSLLAGLLLYGTFTDNPPGDNPTLYQCYAMAFWHGWSEFEKLGLSGCRSFINPDQVLQNGILHTMQQWSLPSDLVQFVANQSPDLPFHALPPEYPLLSILPFLLGLRTFPYSYYVNFQLWMVLFAGSIYLALLCWRSRQAALAYSLYVVSAGWLTAGGRFDIVPAALTLFAMICTRRKHWNVAFVFLALATLMKMYPAILLVPFLLALQRETPGKWYAWRRWVPVGVFVGICVLVIGVSLMLSVAGTLAPLRYFIDRPAQVESLSASMFWISSLLWHTPLSQVDSFGSLNVASPLSGYVTILMNMMLVVGLLSTWWLQRRGRMDLAMACLLTLLIVLMTAKVFSTQYLIWVIPLVAYVGQNNRWWLLYWTPIALLTTWGLEILASKVPSPTSVMLFTLPFSTIRNFLLLAFVLSTLASRFLHSPNEEQAEKREQGWKESIAESNRGGTGSAGEEWHQSRCSDCGFDCQDN